MSILNPCLGSSLQAGAQAPARGGLGAKPSDVLFGRLISGAVLAWRSKALKVTSSVRGKKLQTANPQFHTIPTSLALLSSSTCRLGLGFVFISAFVLFSTACSTSSHRNQHILRVLDRENDVLTAVQKERSREELTKHIALNPVLANSEMRLSEALSELQEANKLVRQALEKEAKEKHR